jgi:hypothetical protein
MANHTCKELTSLLSNAEKAGFQVIWKKSGSFHLIPPQKGIPFFIGHFAERGYHPVRRYIKNVAKINLE